MVNKKEELPKRKENDSYLFPTKEDLLNYKKQWDKKSKKNLYPELFND